MSAPSAITGELSPAKSRRERMKRAAVEGVESATPKIKAALHSAANAVEENAGQCGELSADLIESMLTRNDRGENEPGTLESVRGPVSSCCTTSVESAVQATRPHIDPAVNRTAACSSRAAERGIDCAADSANTCAQGTRSLTSRVSDCF